MDAVAEYVKLARTTIAALDQSDREALDSLLAEFGYFSQEDDTPHD